MPDVEVIQTPEAAARAGPDPLPGPVRAGRARVGHDGRPRPGAAPQKVNYHLRALKARGPVTLVTVRARARWRSAHAPTQGSH